MRWEEVMQKWTSEMARGWGEGGYGQGKHVMAMFKSQSGGCSCS